MKRIGEVVVNFGPTTLGTRIDDTGQDAISDMAKGINVMASRIENLVTHKANTNKAAMSQVGLAL